MYRFALTAFIVCAGLITATPAVAERACGSAREGGHGQPVHVTIALGGLSCAQARAAVGNLRAGHGVEHHIGRGASFAEKSWTFSGGWTCKWGTGGFVCVRGGSGPLRVNKPKEVIDGSYLP
ncbi:MAG TPA: hypothetical protein VMB05_18065 [Solirubrobacteraceae bacterium]|nr:hypothetical protein [Solirubrobacteraceae bacterium]